MFNNTLIREHINQKVSPVIIESGGIKKNPYGANHYG